MHDKVLAAIRQLGGRHNQCRIAEVGFYLNLAPCELRPVIADLRALWLISCATIEGRLGSSEADRAYLTDDGCGLVSIRE